MAKYTHGHHESVLRSHRWRTVANSAQYLRHYLVPGAQVLDVGCGPGTITAEFGELVGPNGSVLGIDVSKDVIELACEEPHDSNVEFRVRNLFDDSLPERSFDVVHAHQVLQHLDDPISALRRMRELAKPGGIVAARDGDFGSSHGFPVSAGLDDWLSLYYALARSNGGEPDAGRRLLSWAHEAGFNEVTPSASVWCFATPTEREWWGELWADRVTRSAFAEQALESGLASEAELQNIADAWRAWSRDRSGWVAITHGEILARA